MNFIFIFAFKPKIGENKMKQELLDALNNNDIAKIQSLIAEDCEIINQRDEGGNTPLHLASLSGCLEVVTLLYISGAQDLNVQNNSTETPLHLAVIGNHKPIVNFLLLKGANINAKKTHEHTALHLALIDGYIDIVKLLISKGADVYAKNDLKAKPVHYIATLYNDGDCDYELSELLVSKGINISEVNLNPEKEEDFFQLEYGILG